VNQLSKPTEHQLSQFREGHIFPSYEELLNAMQSNLTLTACIFAFGVKNGLAGKKVKPKLDKEGFPIIDQTETYIERDSNGKIVATSTSGTFTILVEMVKYDKNKYRIQMGSEPMKKGLNTLESFNINAMLAAAGTENIIIDSILEYNLRDVIRNINKYYTQDQLKSLYNLYFVNDSFEEIESSNVAIEQEVDDIIDIECMICDE